MAVLRPEVKNEFQSLTDRPLERTGLPVASAIDALACAHG